MKQEKELEDYREVLARQEEYLAEVYEDRLFNQDN
jgi:hypothetical protein